MRMVCFERLIHQTDWPQTAAIKQKTGMDLNLNEIYSKEVMISWAQIENFKFLIVLANL